MTKIIVNILFSSWKQYTAIINWVNVTFVSKRPHFNFLSLFQTLPNIAALRVMTYLTGIEIWRAHASQLLSMWWFFQLFWLSYCYIITWLLILYSSPPESTASFFSFRPTWRTLNFQGSECPTKALVLTYNSYFVTLRL